MQNDSPVCLLIDEDLDDHNIFAMAMGESNPHAKCYFEIDSVLAVSKIGRGAIPVPDLIFMEWQMPVASFTDFIRVFTEQDLLRNTHLFLLTSYAHVLSTGSVDITGIKKVIEKQSSIQALALELTEVLTTVV